MKKIGQLTLVALVATAALTSCKKDYTCSCKVAVAAYSETDSMGTTVSWEAQDTTIAYNYAGVAKKDANTQCDGAQATLSTQYKEFFEDKATVNCDLD